METKYALPILLFLIIVLLSACNSYDPYTPIPDNASKPGNTSTKNSTPSDNATSPQVENASRSINVTAPASPVLARYNASLEREKLSSRANDTVFERSASSSSGSPSYAGRTEPEEAGGAMDKVKEAVSDTFSGGDAKKDAIADRPDDIESESNTQQAAPLSGGEINDNLYFDQYLEYFSEATIGPGYEIDVTQRYLIALDDADGKGVLGETLTITDDHDNSYRLTTDSDGKMYFYPSVYLTEHPQEAYRCREPKSRHTKKHYYKPCDGECPAVTDAPYNATYTGFVFNGETCVQEKAVAAEDPYHFDEKAKCMQACPTIEQEFEYPSSFTVEVNGIQKNFSHTDNVWNISLDEKVSNTDGLTVDLAFTLDTTGSMSDQINRLKDTIENISTRIASMPDHPDLRFGLVIYRDVGDEYVTKTYQFTSELARFKERLKSVRADGGGDYKEDVNTALMDTTELLSWSDREQAVHVSFLIADAPPHMDYEQTYDYRTAMLRALEEGIKIYPVASSGLDNSAGEFMFRQIALITNAKYLFITDASGGTSYHVDEEMYTVSHLNDVIVNAVKDELEQIE